MNAYGITHWLLVGPEENELPYTGLAERLSEAMYPEEAHEPEQRGLLRAGYFLGFEQRLKQDVETGALPIYDRQKQLLSGKIGRDRAVVPVSVLGPYLARFGIGIHTRRYPGERSRRNESEHIDSFVEKAAAFEVAVRPGEPPRDENEVDEAAAAAAQEFRAILDQAIASGTLNLVSQEMSQSRLLPQFKYLDADGIELAQELIGQRVSSRTGTWLQPRRLHEALATELAERHAAGFFTVNEASEVMGADALERTEMRQYLTDAVRRGELTARNETTKLPLREDETFREYLSLIRSSEIDDLMQVHGVAFRLDRGAAVTLKKRVLAEDVHREKILNAFALADLDPKRIPSDLREKQAVKAQIRKLLVGKSNGLTEDIFRKIWQLMLNDRTLQEVASR